MSWKVCYLAALAIGLSWSLPHPRLPTQRTATAWRGNGAPIAM
jgi:hypothetical protein